MVNSTLGYAANLNGKAFIVRMIGIYRASMPLHLPCLLSNFNPRYSITLNDMMVLEAPESIM